MDYEKILADLEGANSSDIGTLLMYYIVKNFKKEDRLEAIHSVIRTFGIDFLDNELSKSDKKKVLGLEEILKK